MDLRDAVVVITGAARGIGRVIAEAFVARGAKVALADVLVDELAATANELRAAGGTVLPVVTEVTDTGQVEALIDRAEAELGPLDVQINNAGTFSYIGPAWEAPQDKWFRDVRVNLYGGFLCCRAAVRRMVPRGRGYVINMVSSGGVGDPHPYSTSYASSKAGLMRLTEGLAKECEPHGIKVFAVAPPAVESEMTKFILQDAGGRKWRPGFGEMAAKGGFHPPGIVAQLCVDLVSGRADRLSGRYFRAPIDFGATVARTEEILEGDLLTLRIRKL